MMNKFLIYLSLPPRFAHLRTAELCKLIVANLNIFNLFIMNYPFDFLSTKNGSELTIW